MKRATLLLVLLVVALRNPVPSVALAAGSPEGAAHCSIQRVVIGSFGKTDYAGQFRFLLQDALQRQGFEVVSQSQSADVSLSGIVTMRESVYGGPKAYDIFTITHAYVTVSLRRTDGTEIWRGYFKPRKYKRRVRKGKTPLELRAYDVATSLREACTKGWPSSER